MVEHQEILEVILGPFSKLIDDGLLVFMETEARIGARYWLVDVFFKLLIFQFL
jgi:hypothetical protein